MNVYSYENNSFNEYLMTVGLISVMMRNIE